MTKERYLAGIDAGTTGATVMLIGLDGRVAGSAYREYPCAYPHPGWVEQDLDLVWDRICEASREVIAKTGVNPADICSIGVSSQRGSFACVDRDVRPLHASIVWNDCRAGEQAARLGAAVGADRYHEITGMPVSALWAAPKIMWLAEHAPRIVEGAHAIVNGQEYLLHRLGVETLASDPASLTLNGMMDIARLDWSGEIIAAMGLPRGLFPPMTTPGRREGAVSERGARESGFAPGTPICRGGGDQQCAAVGAGVVREGLAEITVGTAAMMVAHIDSRRPDPEKLAYIGGHAIAGAWDMEGGAFATGACLRWWRDVYGEPEARAARSLGLDVYDVLTFHAAKAPPGSRGCLFFPFMNGQVTPTYDNFARGGMLGLTLAHDRAAMIRSVLEGTAFELRMVAEALATVLGRPFDVLRLTGGGARSALWVQIMADVHGRPIETLEVSECTTFGAAILGGVGAGVFAGIGEAVSALVRPREVVEPASCNRALYDDLFGVFRGAFDALRKAGTFEKLSRIQERL